MPAATARRDEAPPAEPKRSLWEALAHLSIGRTTTGKDSDKAADIVHAGETVMLTEEQAHGFLTRHKVPVIRPAKDQNDPAPAIRARDLFGAQGRPSAAQFGAREDPPGSSSVEVIADPSDPANHPEANDPQTDLNVDPDAAKDK